MFYVKKTPAELDRITDVVLAYRPPKKVKATRRSKRGKLVPVGVKIGDYVLVEKYKGTDIAIDGERLRVLRESEILGVVE